MTEPPQPIKPDPTPCSCDHDHDEKWLALLIRQGLKLIVVGIERHYGLQERDKRAA